MDEWMEGRMTSPATPSLNTATLCLAEQPCSDVAHVRLFELVVLATIAVDADVFESVDDGLNIEAHSDEAVYEILVVAVVSVSCQSSHTNSTW